MKQIVQSLKSGAVRVTDVPCPMVRAGHLLVAASFSLISPGTERMVMDLAQKSLLGKARERPDQVRRVLEKMKNEGVLQTLRQVRAKLDEPMTMGYSSAGVVLGCGEGVQGFKPGDRVASNGPHAEIVCVPKHLCARVPDQVPLDRAAFTVLGAVALQGIRLAGLRLGETAFVIGLGLVGQLTVALLKAAGIRVIATDLDAGKCDLSLKMGATVARQAISAADVEAMTGGLGADAVLITASTSSNQPMELAVEAVRKKGRVVLVGVVGLQLDRRPFYFKECEFVVSSSYGPGRYDPEYEERGHDYPAAYVRWTEQRNMQAVLDLMGRGDLDVSPLISHRFPIEEAGKAYAMIEAGSEPYLGILLEYPGQAPPAPKRCIELNSPRSAGKIGYACLGAGNFARLVLLPILARNPSFEPISLCSAGGLSAAAAGKKLGFHHAVSDEEEVYSDPDVQAVFVVTRHDQHAAQVIRALGASKHVFTEKPLCLTLEELGQIEEALAAAGDEPPMLMVGYNRRFSPAARRVKSFFADVAGPITVNIRFNAGAIPREHWTQNEETGGGRIIGEACHAIDLATFLTGSLPVRVYAESIGGSGAPPVTDDQCFITLRHANGSITSIGYLAGGDRAYPKERVEVIGGGRIALIDDFRKATRTARGKTRTLWSGGQDKGHRAEISAFAEALSKGGPWPIPWEELRSTSLASILAVRSIREGVPFELGIPENF